MSKELKIIKAKIKTRLIELDMTQAELAKQVFVAPSVISELLKYGKGSDYVKEKSQMFQELRILGEITERSIHASKNNTELAEEKSSTQSDDDRQS